MVSTGAVFEEASCTPSTGVGMGFNGNATAAFGKTTRGFCLAFCDSARLVFAKAASTLDNVAVVEAVGRASSLGCSSAVCCAEAGPGASAGFAVVEGSAFFAANFAACAALAAAAFVGALVTGVTVTGKISVLSSRFFLGFGSGAI